MDIVVGHFATRDRGSDKRNTLSGSVAVVFCSLKMLVVLRTDADDQRPTTSCNCIIIIIIIITTITITITITIIITTTTTIIIIIIYLFLISASYELVLSFVFIVSGTSS